MGKPPVEMMLDRLTWVAMPTTPEVHDIPYATHSAELEMAGKRLRCYQLSNGMRIFDAEDVEAFFAPDSD